EWLPPPPPPRGGASPPRGPPAGPPPPARGRPARRPRLVRGGGGAGGGRRRTAPPIRSGGVVTRDGGCVGVDLATGRPAAISWAEAEGGVLCAGPPDGIRLAETCFLLANAGIRRRKPVVVIDLTGSRWLGESLAAACAAAAAPLRCFGAAGPGYYEPVRGGDPAQAAYLVMGMLDWTGST